MLAKQRDNLRLLVWKYEIKAYLCDFVKRGEKLLIIRENKI